jgi:hypothetical protein
MEDYLKVASIAICIAKLRVGTLRFIDNDEAL